jgi:predicted transposase/invertase (TIGR01784 family)
MRRDSIFYAVFQRSPNLLFELLDVAPDSAERYRFESVAVKEPKFEIDGVFLPPSSATPGVVYFCEVQFQKDEKLYERLFAESFLYFYRNRALFSDWEAVVIYPSRSIEQTNARPYGDLLNGDRVHRVYLDELGDIAQLPLGVALMV